jgi:2-methylcitrate dehydratase PrpD
VDTRYFKGHNKSPMSDTEIEAKFRRLTSSLLSEPQITQILAKLWRLETVNDIRDVLKLFATKDAVKH